MIERRRIRDVPASLARFRLSLLVSICRASPLALEIVAAEGVPLERIVRWIRPSRFTTRGWHYRSPHLLHHVCMRLVKAYYVGGFAPEDERFRHIWDRQGVVVRKPSHPRGRYGVWVGNGTLNVVVGLGKATLDVTGPRGVLTLRESVPHALCAAMIGRRIERIAGHPLFTGRDYPVVAACEVAGTTTITFETGLEAIRLPLPCSGSAPRTARRPTTTFDRGGDPG